MGAPNMRENSFKSDFFPEMFYHNKNGDFIGLGVPFKSIWQFLHTISTNLTPNFIDLGKLSVA